MKKILFCTFILPLLSACASSDTDSDTASNRGEATYVTGSNLPVRKSKSTNVQTISGEEAAASMRSIRNINQLAN